MDWTVRFFSLEEDARFPGRRSTLGIMKLEKITR
jgi:hypothetical protein